GAPQPSLPPIHEEDERDDDDMAPFGLGLDNDYDFHDTYGVFSATERDLFYILGNQLRKESLPGTVDIPFLQLEEWVEEYARQGFKKRFGFEYDGDKSVVPEKGGGIVLPFSSLFHLKKHPATDAEVLKWVHASVLSADNRVAARDRIINIVRETVVQSVNDGAVAINQWFTAGTPVSGQIFEDKENKGYDMQMRAYYLFVHAKLQVITTWRDPWSFAPQSTGASASASGAAPVKTVKEYIHIPPQRFSSVID
ncbi:hypothetical protein P691DRAFT_785272, partial [Macrolepiota fuliginosa MF-IS2]